MRRLALPVLLVLLTALLARTSAVAGPPCACWPFDVGDLPTLPEAEGKAGGLSPGQAVARALELLDARLPVLARMETLRRLAFHLEGDARLADHVASRLFARALDAEAKGEAHRAVAWFDAGYLVSALSQIGLLDGLDGYAWIQRAIRLSGDDGAMHLAAALTVLMPNHPAHARHAGHMERATAAAAEDPLLARNLERVRKQSEELLGYFASKSRR
jgi:hypothetical protein